MLKPTDRDYRTADAMIEYYRRYDKLGQREWEKGAAKRSADKDNKPATGNREMQL